MHRRHLHVLVVEDSDADAVVVHERLTEAAPIDVRVDRVPSLGQAVASLEQTAFDAVIYDMGLPDAQGLPGFRELALAAPDTPIVILTGNDDADTASTALAERAQEFLPKQMMDSPWLLRAVQHAIERHRLLVEVESLALEDPVTGLHNRRGLDFLGRQHLQRYLDEIVWRWNHREPVREVVKQWTNKKGIAREKSTTIWKPIPVVDQMRVLLQGAVGKQIRRSKEYGPCWP